ncbi:MAG: S53 family peptidase [Anaerolineaceae bacterium]|nr:S53 family peptidase [Anaerolineaceae bacterium]
MPAKPKRIAISGSERAPLPGARAVGAVPDDERFEVTVRVRPKSPLDPSAAKVNADVLPKDRRYMSRQDFAKEHGADPADMNKVTAFAQSHGLVVVQSSPDRRSIVLSGTAAAFSAAFGVKLEQFEHDQGTFRGRSGALTIPSDLDGIIEGVFGLDDRPQARPHFQCRPASIKPMAAGAASFTPPQLAKLYDFPAGLDGTGECIAIIELGGGYRTADIKTYFKGLGLPVPKVKTVRVDGAKNHPTTPDGADGEVMLDIEVAAAIAPKSSIVVYFAPNTDQGFLDAVTQALHDNTNKPSVISISWGGPEASWTSQSMTQYDQAFQTAAALGVTICVAAGDNGSSDGETDGAVHVDFPASSPNVLACGGTELFASGSSISNETVWNENANSATGGGYSSNFPLPDYQKSLKTPVAFRGVPDVAGDADPNSGYQVRVDGQNMVIGGTSAVAPLWAGLIALLNQKLGTSVGFLNPLLYGSLSGKSLFNDITSGNNGAYAAGPGWDACTGWGSPDGSKLLAALAG